MTPPDRGGPPVLPNADRLDLHVSAVAHDPNLAV